MKKLIFLSVLVILFCIHHPVSAHVLSTDGSIGAVLHITPDDDPMVGVPAYFYFEFKDKEDKFDESICTCVATIFQNGQKIDNILLTNSSFSYTFPQKDIYTIKVSGSTTVANSFQPFALTYDVRVSRESTNQISAGELNLRFWDIPGGFIVFTVFVILLLLAIILYIKKEK